MKKNFFKRFVQIFIIVSICFSALLFAGCGEQQNEVRVDGIEISKKNIYLAEGQTAVISAQVFPFNANNQNYTFESSNDSVVTCEDGFVVAKKAGDAVISVYSEEGGYKDSCNVLVTKASDNLELNNFNNLNMPPKELQPIYNSEDNVQKTNASPIKNDCQSTFKVFKDYALQKLDNEIQSDIEAGKNVLNNIKEEFDLFAKNLEIQKDVFKNTYSGGQNAMIGAFNNLHDAMIDEMQKTNQSMNQTIDDLNEKIESGEYTVESRQINGVTFVVISNSNNQNEKI